MKENVSSAQKGGSAHTVIPPKPRLDSIDFLRGAVMVVMAIDHTRDFFSIYRFEALDLTQTNALLFMTRWITHYCAPVFVFLAGTGAFLSSSRGKTKPELSKFLMTRGMWLIFLEFTVIRFGWLLNLDYTLSFGQVIWAIGISMIALSGLIYLPARTVTAFGVAMIALHNLLDGITPSQLGIFGWPWQIIHSGGAIIFPPNYVLHCTIPAYSVDRRHGCGVRLRRALAERRTNEEPDAVEAGLRDDHCVYCYSVDELLRRSPTLVAAKEFSLYGIFIRQM